MKFFLAAVVVANVIHSVTCIIFKIFGQQRYLFLGCSLSCDKFCFSAGDTVVVVVVAKH